MEFRKLFKQATGWSEPQTWQTELAAPYCSSRLVRIPTGFGKTAGALLAWLWNRVYRNDENWPRRLVWCLPMRVLVEQTEQEVCEAIKALGLLWDCKGDHRGKVGVHVLMGGLDAGEWHLYPEENAIIIGTQDMLISRALNRGYGSPRARWPMEFGLLNQDALWVMDEVQLMDVGLATITQLQAFREQDKAKSRRPCLTWWMSATLQRDWLAKSPDTQDLAASLHQLDITPEQRHGRLWTDVTKPCKFETLVKDNELARRVAQAHVDAGRGQAGPTLVVVNRVERALAVYECLCREKSLEGSDIRLIHSRFRSCERKQWRDAFLNRNACGPGTDRIIITTQVVEAGVNISAALLFTDLAPWPSLVQRFGRSARWGGAAQIYVVDFSPKNDKAAAPYAMNELDGARDALARLDNVSPLHLETFEENNPDLLPALYPFEPKNLLLRHELDELFDTTPDLTGADIDISRFIRSGEERDLSVFWRDLSGNNKPDNTCRPVRDELCSVPFLKARDWLCGEEKKGAKNPRLKTTIRAWVWDWLEGKWQPAERWDLYPGQTVLVAANSGGYTQDKGWDPKSTASVPLFKVDFYPEPEDLADASQDDESLSNYPWKTIATHGWETGVLAKTIVTALDERLAGLFELAGRWHDAGKVFPAFNGSIRIDYTGRPQRQDLAKAPPEAWHRGKTLYPMPDGTHRPGFRHELISVLALFSVLQRHQPDHPALLGPWRELFAQMGQVVPAPVEAQPSSTSLEREILSLDVQSFNLLAYLICCHHGKLRLAWHASPADQAAALTKQRLRGVEEGDDVPSLTLCDSDGRQQLLPGFIANLDLAAAGLSSKTGAGWTERSLSLLKQHGPFALAWMEALLRAADQRASRNENTEDPMLVMELEVATS